MRLSLVLIAVCILCILLWPMGQSAHAQVPGGPTTAPTQSESPIPAPVQDNNAENTTRDRRASDPVEVYRRTTYLTAPEFYLSVMTLVLGLAALIMEFWLLKSNAVKAADDALRIFAVTIILIGALLATTAGYSASDISPAIGLFGTVAGYLLGRGASRNEGKKDEKP